MMKTKLNHSKLLILSVFICTQAAWAFQESPKPEAQAPTNAAEVGAQTLVPVEPYTLDMVRMVMHGPNYKKPSPESLVGKYIAETGAATIVRAFYQGPENSILPPHKLGPKRLVVAVSRETFPVFKKYFSTKNFLFLLNEHGNFAAFKGKRSLAQRDGGDYWNGQLLAADFKMLDENYVAIPLLLSSTEGARAEKYFKLASYFPNGRESYARSPWKLVSKTNSSLNYCAYGAWASGCGTWIGNMPIGDKRVNEYIFPSGDEDGRNPYRKKLEAYEDPTDVKDPKVLKLLHQVWQVPGFQQLGEIVNPMANRRGEFDNAGFTTFTFMGSASVERIPVVFYFVKDAKKPLKPDFYFIQDSAY